MAAAGIPEQVPVFAAVEAEVSGPRRAGLVCSRLVRSTSTVPGRRFPIDTAEEILLRAARDLGVLDLVILIDSALELGHLDPAAVDRPPREPTAGCAAAPRGVRPRHAEV